ncbi:L-2-amino-thiazoline-4-carboxylic acid hydrolase [Draconibacterium sp. IB214405]|uniref:L-2-amino-thiazoline-4-carboxylic acid hydrolase n=1 Tax=Draconibacterium sp. IB214405 TaxID=3097352 RepID=UPI002A0DAFCA|nr:L-2-amino-thiazoline-4-carboxylic acid hydrolase [Draconibacterium sp. IB214405]MDX8338434.1 L-2-amino-thiazoline-4-carboxylic acid hydrolase [Draconibacterium sp. IB214405]
MSNKNQESSRRQFLFKTAIAGSLLGFGCPKLFASNFVGKNGAEPDKAVEETVRFVYQNHIPIYKGLAKEMGEENLNKMLQKVSAENWANAIKMMSKDIKEKNIENYATLMASVLGSPPYNSLLKYEVSEQTDKAIEIKYTECLVSKIYKEMGAADIGWSIECSAGDTSVKAYNPKMTCKSLKNLMKGDDVCIERIELKA